MPQLDGKALKNSSVTPPKLNINADLSVGGNKVTNLGTPTAGTDAATKTYADSITTQVVDAETLLWLGL